jgi:type II secretory pathway pseudopilin PulG
VHRPRRRRPPAFTLAEIAVVVAAIGVALSLGVAGIVEMTVTQKRNASLAMANLAVREQRALALERRTPRFVKPASAGAGLVTGTAQVDGTDCSELVVDPVTPTPGIEVDGQLICFNENGESIIDDRRTLQFRIPGETIALAEVTVFKAGTLAWTGAIVQSASLADTNLTVKSIATQDTNLAVFQ